MYLPEESGNFTPAPEGLHRAVCCSFIDYGTQFSEFYGKSAHKVLLGWELVDEMRETSDGEKPFYVTRFYTWSMNKKAALRSDLESWRGKKFSADELSGSNGAKRFDVRNLIGAPCMVNIIHEDGKDGVQARISSITPLPKGTAKPKPINEPVYFSLDVDEYSKAAFERLNEKTREKIQRSPEWKELNGISTGAPAKGGQTLKHELDDEIPF
jgi:hypothetical protein